MNKCPECDGKGGYDFVQHDQACIMAEDACIHIPEWRRCRACDGEGTMSDLKLAVYRARGGAAPSTMRGFA